MGTDETPLHTLSHCVRCVLLCMCDPLWRFFLVYVCACLCSLLFLCVCVCVCMLFKQAFSSTSRQERSVRALHAHAMQKTQNKTQKRRKTTRLCVAALRKLCCSPFLLPFHKKKICLCVYACSLSFFVSFIMYNVYVYRPECGRTTRRT